MDTDQQIRDVAAALIKERGYHGFSFQDISERVGIRKASIHYHFPSKAALGVAVVQAYRKAMQQPLPQDHWAALNAFLTPILGFGRVQADACLCGALGGEFLSLPPELQAEVTGFFAEQTDWLTRLLTSGRTAGAFRFADDPAALARFILAAIEGAMLIKRTSGNTQYVDEVAAMAATLLGREPFLEATA